MMHFPPTQLGQRAVSDFRLWASELREDRAARIVANMFPVLGATRDIAAQRLAEEYCIDFNVARVAETLRMPEDQARKQLARPRVVLAIHRQLTRLNAMTELKAEYVRDYIVSVMELCPTDFFTPAPEGGWLITQENFGSLPREVKRLIESVELRYIRGATYLAVQFVSKTQALNLAARHTLTQHIDATVRTMTFEDLQKAMNEPSPEDHIERRITDASRPGGQAVPSDPPPLANGHAVPRAEGGNGFAG